MTQRWQENSSFRCMRDMLHLTAVIEGGHSFNLSPFIPRIGIGIIDFTQRHFSAGDKKIKIPTVNKSMLQTHRFCSGFAGYRSVLQNWTRLHPVFEMFIDWSADEGLKKNLIFSFGINRSLSQTNFTVSVHDAPSVRYESHSMWLCYIYSLAHLLTMCLQHLRAIAALLKDSKQHPAPTGWVNLFVFLPQYVSVILGSAAFV